jgi:hypothetical protein
MTRVEVLELRVDATQLDQGLKTAETALERTGDKAKKAGDSVKALGATGKVAGNNLNAAFAATSGGLGVTRGLVSMTDGLKSANFGMAGFAASQALLDLGRFSSDMRAVGSATGAASGAFGKLGAIIKANPLMAVAAVIAAAATAMSMFGEETKKTASDFDKLRASMTGAFALGLPDASSLAATGRARHIAGMMTQLHDPYSKLSEMSVLRPSVSRGFGLSSETPLWRQKDLREQLGITKTQYETGMGAEPGWRQGLGRRDIRDAEHKMQYVTKGAVQMLIRSLYDEAQKEIERHVAKKAADGRTGGVFGTANIGGGGPIHRFGLGYNPSEFNWDLTTAGLENTRLSEFARKQRQNASLSPGQGPLSGAAQLSPFLPAYSQPGAGTVLQSPEERAQMERDIATRNAELALAHMNDLIQKGEEFGQTIGDAFSRVAEGTMTARQAMAELVRQFAQMASSSIFRQIGGAVGSSFAPTQTQAGVDPAPTFDNPGG